MANVTSDCTTGKCDTALLKPGERNIYHVHLCMFRRL